MNRKLVDETVNELLAIIRKHRIDTKPKPHNYLYLLVALIVVMPLLLFAYSIGHNFTGSALQHPKTDIVNPNKNHMQITPADYSINQPDSLKPYHFLPGCSRHLRLKKNVNNLSSETNCRPVAKEGVW